MMSFKNPSLSETERRVAAALAQALIPGTARIPAADAQDVERAEEVIREFSPVLVKPWALLQRGMDLLSLPRTGKRFRDLSPADRETVLKGWQSGQAMRAPLSVLSLVYKLVHFDDPRVQRCMGARVREQPKTLEQPRWLEQIHKAAEWAEGDLECDVVVVGTGSGGAIVGRELAERGHAVVFLERGEHYRRDAFTGSSVAAHQKFYRGAASLGNAVMPIFIGELVGGSTAVNGATCFRTPPWVLDRWCEQLGTDEFSALSMDRWFEKVEGNIEVAPANQPEVGPIRGVIARGCDALGWSHFAIRRNVNGCTGSGFCDFGCPSDARRSMNLSYIPAALNSGAQLFTGAHVDRVLVEGGRAVGVEADAGGGRRLKVRARVVVLCGGAVPTPLLLLKQGLCNRSGEVGKNLTLHPSTGVSGLFDEEIKGFHHIPQGYGCDQFLRQGELITAAQPDVNVAATMFPVGGDHLMQTLELLPRMASLAILIHDASSNGRIWGEVAGRPAITYWFTRKDRELLHSGMVHIMELLRAAGARRFFPTRMSTPVVELADLDKFRKNVPAAADLSVISYHPLGTCKMGRDPKKSVVGLDHQAHDVRRLFIVDGSTVPSALGVNPQLTIMAMATRAAERIHDTLG
ncbi:MAG TPA: GMC family oxidoreductase [Myxococcales bacterium]